MSYAFIDVRFLVFLSQDVVLFRALGGQRVIGVRFLVFLSKDVVLFSALDSWGSRWDSLSWDSRRCGRGAAVGAAQPHPDQLSS